MRSLHQKITIAYLAMAAVITALALFAFLDMLFLERQIREGVAIHKLKESVLEIRLQEKNLLLYKKSAEHAEILRLVDEALESLNRSRPLLHKLWPGGNLQRIEQLLNTYLDLIRDHQHTPDSQEQAIRSAGQAVLAAVDETANLEREMLARSVSESQWALALSFLLVLLAVVAVGHRLSRVVVQPLREMEQDLAPIAQGQLDRLTLRSQEQELVTFTQAINQMLSELESRRRRLLQSEKLAALGTLAAGVAHEINNPLANISSSAQLLMEEVNTAPPSELAEWADQIVRETERAHRIVSALLDYGRRQDFRLETLVLKELLDATLLLLHGVIKQSGGSVDLQIPPGLYIRADSQRMQQVFINLIHNALLAIRPAGHVGVTAMEEAHASPLGTEFLIIGEVKCRGGPSLRIDIVDDGPGISSEALSKVFEPFFTTRATGQGMGLGLYIVQEIVQQHDGCIAIDSSPAGTHVVVRLPAAEIDSTELYHE